MKSFFSKLLSGSGDVSSKRFAFILVVVAGTVWLSIDLRNGTTPGWVDAFQALITVACGGYVLGKGVERFGNEPTDTSKNEIDISNNEYEEKRNDE